MSSINTVILTGNVTRDPECKYDGQDCKIAKFSVAVNKKWKDRETGEVKEKTAFVDCVAWPKLAGIVAQYCKTGTKVAIEGELEQERWEAQDGSKRQKLVVKVRQLELLGGAPADSPGHHGHYQAPPAQGQEQQQQFVDPNNPDPF